MTDGIIQDIFKKHVSPYPYPFGAILTGNVMKIQQELIEKIKQRFPVDYDENYSMWHEAIQKALIGDNQE